jgi:Protein CHAPERONE-LIKE PROTEIN OF POR1-like
MEENRMSEQTPYEMLQVSEDATFEEVQAARDLLIAATQEEKQRQAIETAYDAVLMDRLRLRQEGKIKVPERIRFAERLTEPRPAKVSLPNINQSPAWLQRLLDTPEPRGIIISGGVYSGLAALCLYAKSPDALSVVLAIAVGFNIFWLNRKERKLGRAFLLTLIALVLGVAIATAILQAVAAPLGLGPELFVGLVVMVVFWLVSSFLR